MKCYGIEYQKKQNCINCKLSQWCKDAADIPYAIRGGVELEVAANLIDHSTPPAIMESSSKKPEKKEYTRSDLLEIISFMLSMDEKTLELLDEKIRDPDVRFSDLARKRQVSRQAIHKQVLKKCRQIPELELILRNRRKKIENNNKTTFMEAVCQIRRKMSGKKSQQQNKNSRYSGRLTCLTRSLDLSRMSIFKGDQSLTHAWRNRPSLLQRQ